MFIKTTSLIITATTLTISPVEKPQVFYLDGDYSVEAAEYLRSIRQPESNIEELLYENLLKEMSEDLNVSP
jgi:hypothetical protein